MTTRRIEPVLPGPRCDDSGLCGVVEQVHGGGISGRCLAVEDEALALVDISPVQVGHSLVSPYEHVTSTLLLSEAARTGVWKLAEDTAAQVSALLDKAVLLVEHGLTPAYRGPSCVRHAHVHVGPIDRADEAEELLTMLVDDIKFGDDGRSALDRVAGRESHIAGRVGERWFSGVPRADVRQVTRVLLSSLSARPLRDVDWGLGALGGDYRRTLELFGLKHVQTEVGTGPR